MKQHGPVVFRDLVLAALLSVMVPGILLSQSVQVPIEKLAKSADLIAVGKVTAMKSEWVGNKERIITVVTLAVDQSLKGEGPTGGTVNITTLGGEIGEVGELYTHVPTFRENESVVVFLEKFDKTSYRVAGGEQGKYIIEKDPASGRFVVAGKQKLEDFTAAVKKAVQE